MLTNRFFCAFVGTAHMLINVLTTGLTSLQQLAAVMKQQGASCWLDEASSELMVAPSSIINMQQVTMQPPTRPEDQLTHTTTFSSSAMSQAYATTTQVDFVEDSSPVSGDPMLTSAPVSPDNDDSMF